jgi:hypothetical protein
MSRYMEKISHARKDISRRYEKVTGGHEGIYAVKYDM